MTLSRALLHDAQGIIHNGHKEAPLGAICWSGGKDSMVLLHLMRQLDYRLPVIFFREPWQPRKYVFHDQLIRDWNLFILSWHPAAVAYQQVGDEFEVQNRYVIGQIDMTCPTGIIPPVGDLPWACGLAMGNRPTQASLEIYPHLQSLWVGHKRSDGDPILGGDAGTRVQGLVRADGSRTFFPLRDWTDADVWAYIEKFNVPYDAERYEKHEGVWRERPDRRHNADYVHACMACVDRRPDAPRVVHCPKLDMDVANCSEDLAWVEPKKLKYMEDGAKASS